jgi:hypothetical protein
MFSLEVPVSHGEHEVGLDLDGLGVPGMGQNHSRVRMKSLVFLLTETAGVWNKHEGGAVIRPCESPHQHTAVVLA